MVSLVKLFRWLGLPRRTLYYRPKPRRRVINAELAIRVKLALDRFPTYGYRRLACVLGENRKPIQRILQLKGWQVRKRPQASGLAPGACRQSPQGLTGDGPPISPTCGVERIDGPADQHIVVALGDVNRNP
ncbi:hypothetical protein [Halomonas sp. BC04]|uniref:hypothetical protein n=1 Tax=Halomonas sp. BC04 TaxID=1403540 RepID=UPI0018CC7499|nr:hypothetical protein [Halomonas sp. BC04]